MNNTLRFTILRGECRRQMNGAVASSMRYYGAKYSLNYGVSLSTIRSIAANENKDHEFAKYLFSEYQIREICLISLHLAEAKMITIEELDFWAKGIINSEMAEEGAFALFQYVDGIEQWLDSEDELLIYTSLLSIAKSKSIQLSEIEESLMRVLQRDTMLIKSAIVILLESYYRDVAHREDVNHITASMPDGEIADYIKSELEWRCACY